MIQISNWDAIQEAGNFDNPIPGAYIGIIRSVEDVEAKEYLAIRWDFAEGVYQGFNGETFDRAGFWPTVLIRSYKEKALGFFKAFKTSVERSNPGYVFNTGNVQGLVGKYVGIVLGEEEYRKNNGEIGTRLYVAQARSIHDIRDGDFQIPEKKRLTEPTRPAYAASYPAHNNSFSVIDDDNPGDLPF